MSESMDVVRAAVRQITTDFSAQAAVVKSEESGWNTALWQAMNESGFSGVSVSEEVGGSGGTIAQACAVLAELGSASASVPFAEHTLIGGWLLHLGGRELPQTVVTVVEDTSGLMLQPASGGYLVNGQAKFVPWGRASEHVLAVFDLDGAAVCVNIPSKAIQWSLATNLAQEARDSFEVADVLIPQDESWVVPEGTIEEMRLRGALSRASLIAGALGRVAKITVRYTSEREQFGRPISRFQAVQRHLVRLVEVARQAEIASEVAAMNAEYGLDFFDVASAKIVANDAATVATAAAHQSHGAIGMTKEYELGQLSRRLWSWRGEFGSDRYWETRLGERLERIGSESLWPRITEGLRSEEVAIDV